MTFGIRYIMTETYWITLETLRSLFYYTVTTVHNTQIKFLIFGYFANSIYTVTAV